MPTYATKKNCVSKERPRFIMDYTETLSSPRKKVRLNQPANGSTDDVVTMTKISPAQVNEAALQEDKETQCGITESIDSSLQTFEGVMKQRWTLPCWLRVMS